MKIDVTENILKQKKCIPFGWQVHNVIISVRYEKFAWR